jgi:hypothetical protein
MEMRVQLVGEIVDTDENQWEMNGKTGVSHTIFVRSGSARDSAQRVRVSPKQFGALESQVGVEVEWPVDVFAQANDYGGAKLRVTLDPEYAVGAELRSASSF